MHSTNCSKLQSKIEIMKNNTAQYNTMKNGSSIELYVQLYTSLMGNGKNRIVRLALRICAVQHKPHLKKNTTH